MAFFNWPSVIARIPSNERLKRFMQSTGRLYLSATESRVDIRSIRFEGAGGKKAEWDLSKGEE